jgi:alanine racemase
MTSADTSQIHVDLTAVEHNFAVIREIVGPDCAVCPVLKADGYGLGAAQAARHLEAAGARMLAVFSPAQAAALARAAVGGPILVLMPVHRLERVDEAYRLLISGRLHLTAHDREHVEDLLALAEHFATVIPIHLEIDTGMSRGGCSPDDARELLQRIAATRWLRLAGICTQMANAVAQSPANDKQLERFEGVLDAAGDLIGPDVLIHLANTYATLRHRKYHKNMVRIGLAWTGYGPDWMTGGRLRRQAAGMRPVVSWRSRMMAVRWFKRGAKVGYGSTWTTRRRTRVGLIPVGYGDGYPRALATTDGNAKPPCVGVAVGDGPMRFVRVVGQVNMDQIAVDLTDLGEESAGVGTPVELIGQDPEAPNHLPALARAAGMLPHEILCGLNARIRRVYHAKAIEPKPSVAPVAAK